MQESFKTLSVVYNKNELALRWSYEGLGVTLTNIKQYTVLIDGYNTIHSVPELQTLIGSSLEAARNALLKYCSTWLSNNPNHSKILVIFDGDSTVGPFSNSRSYKNIYSIFTKTKESADNRIIHLVKNRDESTKMIIVTDDSDIHSRAINMGVMTINNSDFYQSEMKPKRNKREIRIESAESELTSAEKDNISKELMALWCPRRSNK